MVLFSSVQDNLHHVVLLVALFVYEAVDNRISCYFFLHAFQNRIRIEPVGELVPDIEYVVPVGVGNHRGVSSDYGVGNLNGLAFLGENGREEEPYLDYLSQVSCIDLVRREVRVSKAEADFVLPLSLSLKTS